MSPKNQKARVTLAAALVDAISLPSDVRVVERVSRGRSNSVILEANASGLLQLSSAVLASSVRKDERERAADRIQKAVKDIETGEAAGAASAREKVAAKVAKLLEHARSAKDDLGNAEEAAAFVAKADELLIKFELGLSEVEYQALEEVDPMGQQTVRFDKADAQELPNPQWKHAPKMHTNQRRAWQQTLCSSVAKAFFCKMMYVSGSTNVILVGRESHRQMAEYVMVALVRDCLRFSERAYWDAVYAQRRKDPNAPQTEGFKNAFYNGFTGAVATRLMESRRADQAAAREASDGKALIRLDNAQKAVERYFEEKVPHARGQVVAGRYTVSNNGAREMGRAAGMSANISANGLGAGKGARSPLSLGSGS